MSRVYREDASQVAFPVGGIGTGTYSVGARGQFMDFEWFNRPGKGNRIPYTFFAMYMKEEGREPQARVLEARLSPPYTRSHGYQVGDCAGLPRFETSEFQAEYPFARIRLRDEKVPLEVEMETFNPFIPLDDENSGIPGGVIRYRIANPTDHAAEVAVCGSVTNVAGVSAFERERWESLEWDDCGETQYRDDGEIRGLYCYCTKLSSRHLHFGNHSLTTSDRNVTYKENWLNRGNWDGFRDFWNEFRQHGRLTPKSSYLAVNAGDEREMRTGSLCIEKVLQPGESYTFEFVLSWYYPNRQDNWEYDYCSCGNCESHSIRNYYATRFGSAWDAASFLHRNLAGLEARTRRFTRVLYDSSLPAEVIDSVANNIVTIRSTVCFRIEDGTFLGWEGGFETEGCCEGNCTHVWNYAQTLAFLFPKLEQTMRRVEFLLETDDTGRMAFRTRRVFGKEGGEYHPAADGQMGCVLRLYRDFLLTGDLDYVKELWPKARLALAYGDRYWDSNHDGVLDAKQHNTYDIEFYGENSLTNSVYYAALRAAEEIERRLGNEAEAQRYHELWERGSALMDRMLWDGEYYRQNTEDVNRYLYQYGAGCLSDQVLGQVLAHVNHLGYILPGEHVKSAVASVYKYNFKHSFSEFQCTQRVYALNDETGLVLCTWPKSEEPHLPFIYSDEVWAGVEYQVAAHLIYERYREEGLEIVRGVRSRYDGYRRNPYCEVECGNHYVRSMASYMLLTALSGFSCDMSENRISFAPRYSEEDFRAFFCTGKAWGVLRQTMGADGVRRQWVEILEGEELKLELEEGKTDE